jgi:hypothetical protein
LIVYDGIGEAGFAKQRIGEWVAKQRGIGKGRDENEDAQPRSFEFDTFSDITIQAMIAMSKWAFRRSRVLMVMRVRHGRENERT